MVTIHPSNEVESWQNAVMLVNLIIALYPGTAIFGGVGGVPALANYLEPMLNQRVDFNVLLDRAWYGTQGGFRLLIPGNVQAVAPFGYADRERNYHWNQIVREVQNWLFNASK